MTAEPLPAFMSIMPQRSRLGRADEIEVAQPADSHDGDELATLRQVVGRQRRVAHRTQLLSELLERRADLVGVHGPADLAVEAARWSA
ncbi:MAG: hypothetical protein ABWZ91_15675 [Nocardioides sp.]